MSQALPLVEQLRNLEQLQELDLKIDSIKKNQSSLPMSLKLIDDSLDKLKIEIDTKRTQIAEIDKGDGCSIKRKSRSNYSYRRHSS